MSDSEKNETEPKTEPTTEEKEEPEKEIEKKSVKSSPKKVAKSPLKRKKENGKDEAEEESPRKMAKSPMKKKEETKESEKEEEGKDEDDDSQEEVMEARLGLLDKPVEMKGTRERKKVERLSMPEAKPQPEDKNEIPAGRGTKLGEIERVEFQLKKVNSDGLKPLHRLLFNKQGSVSICFSI
ncbi:uncharacterized protein LOC144356194 [Saccoglossus kowalevskii]